MGLTHLLLAAATPRHFAGASQTFTVYTPPITLRPSEVHNRPVPPFPMPEWVVASFRKGESMFVSSFEVDIVRFDSDGQEESVPLFDTYNHHYVLYLGSNQSMGRLYDDMKGYDPIGHVPCWHSQPTCRLDSMKHGARCLKHLQATQAGYEYSAFGGASGGEFRNNPHDFPAPFGFVVERPEALVTVFHLINTENTTEHDGGTDPYSHLLECPCTSRRHFNLTNNTIDGCAPAPAFQCNDFFEATKNPACHLATYTGGYRCCENGVFLEERPAPGPAVTVHGKITMTFTKASAASRGLAQTDCCDVTAHPSEGFANIEYTVPACDGTECVHVATNVQMLDASQAPDSLWDLVYAAGHVHTGALRLELVDEETGQLLCEAGLRYGASSRAGDERGYLVGIQPCVWAHPPRMRADHMLRTVAYYNSSRQHNGVMSLWLMSASPVVNGTGDMFV